MMGSPICSLRDLEKLYWTQLHLVQQSVSFITNSLANLTYYTMLPASKLNYLAVAGYSKSDQKVLNLIQGLSW